jgi:hypothetical protein
MFLLSVLVGRDIYDLSFLVRLRPIRNSLRNGVSHTVKQGGEDAR